MNKKVKVIVGIILIFFIVLSVIILITAKNKEASENKEVSKTSNLTSTILKISDNYVTMQDENNIIYTFFITEALNLEVGDVIQLEYKGELNTSKEIQDNEVVSYEVLEKVSSPSIIEFFTINFFRYLLSENAQAFTSLVSLGIINFVLNLFFSG